MNKFRSIEHSYYPPREKDFYSKITKDQGEKRISIYVNQQSVLHLCFREKYTL